MSAASGLLFLSGCLWSMVSMIYSGSFYAYHFCASLTYAFLISDLEEVRGIASKSYKLSSEQLKRISITANKKITALLMAL